MIKASFSAAAAAVLLIGLTGCESMDDTPSGQANEGVLGPTPTVSETFHQSPAEKKVMMIQLLDDEYKKGQMTEAEYNAKREKILDTY